MFERYTEKARRVIFFARYEASELGAPAIDAEHIFLGILREDKRVAEKYFGSTVYDLRELIKRRFPPTANLPASADMTLSPGAKEVLQFAAAESDALGQSHIGTEHLMLGLLKEGKSYAAELLQRRGITLESAREAIRSEIDVQVHDTNVGGAMAYWPHNEFISRQAEQLIKLAQALVRRGVIDQQDLDQQIGSLRGHVSFDAATFSWLIDLLVSKGAISEDDKREIFGSGR